MKPVQVNSFNIFLVYEKNSTSMLPENEEFQIWFCMSDQGLLAVTIRQSKQNKQKLQDL